MHGHDAKSWQAVQRDRAQDTSQALVEHNPIQAEHDPEEGQQRPECVFQAPTPLLRASISTDRIMHAIRQQRNATQQLEDIRHQQQTRVERMRPVAAGTIALSLFLLSSIPLFCLAMLLIRTDLIASVISVLSGVLDICIILAQYLQEGLTLLMHNNMLLSGLAFAIVVMMGMWLRLMRPPREA